MHYPTKGGTLDNSSYCNNSTLKMIYDEVLGNHSSEIYANELNKALIELGLIYSQRTDTSSNSTCTNK